MKEQETFDIMGITLNEQYFPAFKEDMFVIEIMNDENSDIQLQDNDEEMTIRFRNTSGVETYIHIERELFSKMVSSFLENQD
jgi:type II secretory ATPase GspE/PulE/Tfp pilus assembly ATPase PilB-like protein